MHPLLRHGLDRGVFWITERIAIGQFASKQRCEWLLEQRVTHILNCGDAESVAQATAAGFRQVIDVPIADLTPIPVEVALRLIDLIHEALSEPGTKLYLHCVAGQNRSPTILWLFLLACGMDENEAMRLIVERCPDAVPGHRSLVRASLIEAVRAFGKDRVAPQPDASVLKPAY